MRELVAATSVGMFGGTARLDLEYVEDVGADVDMNLVALESGRLVEVQGTAEGVSFSTTELDGMVRLGLDGIARLIRHQREAIAG
jgi:ribonuclease PH